jgi:archaellum component FlaC
MCFIFCPQIINQQSSLYHDIFPYYENEIYDLQKKSVTIFKNIETNINKLENVNQKNYIFSDNLNNELSTNIEDAKKQIENLKIIKKYLLNETFFFSKKIKSMEKILAHYNKNIDKILLNLK